MMPTLFWCDVTSSLTSNSPEQKIMKLRTDVLVHFLCKMPKGTEKLRHRRVPAVHTGKHPGTWHLFVVHLTRFRLSSHNSELGTLLPRIHRPVHCCNTTCSPKMASSFENDLRDILLEVKCTQSLITCTNRTEESRRTYLKIRHIIKQEHQMTKQLLDYQLHRLLTHSKINSIRRARILYRQQKESDSYWYQYAFISERLVDQSVIFFDLFHA